MTFITTNSPISTIIKEQCSTLGSKQSLTYEVGKNNAGDLFIRITNYGGAVTTTYSHDWFAIVDLAHAFTLANGSPVQSFEPFDNNGNPLKIITNKNPSAFLKAVLLDAIK